MKVEHVTSPFEADNDIADLGEALHCPVVSNDSDFFIFPLSHGFIPLDSVKFSLEKESCDCCAQGWHNYVTCRRYLVSEVHLPHVGPVRWEMLPLMAAVCGNDVFQGPSELENLFSYQMKSGKKHGKFTQFLLWSSKFDDVETALAKLLQSLGKNLPKKEKLERDIRVALQRYALKECWIVGYFSSGVLPPAVQQFAGVPTRVLQAFHRGEVQANVVNAVVNGYALLPCGMEDLGVESVHDSARELRDFLYRVMKPGVELKIVEYRRAPFKVEKLHCCVTQNGENDLQRLSDLLPGDLEQGWMVKLMLYWDAVSPVPLTAALKMAVCLSIIFQSGRETADQSLASLEKFLDEPAVNRAKPFNLSVVHAVSLLQTLYLCLHQLLQVLLPAQAHPQLLPLPPGRLVYNLAACLTRKSPDTRLQTAASWLNGKNSAYYKSFLTFWEPLQIE